MLAAHAELAHFCRADLKRRMNHPKRRTTVVSRRASLRKHDEVGRIGDRKHKACGVGDEPADQEIRDRLDLRDPGRWIERWRITTAVASFDSNTRVKSNGIRLLS
jgi:hypothetical protein